MDRKRIAVMLRKRRSLLIIVIAALLLEFLSATQYYLTRSILADELEKRAESELTIKAILIKSNMNDAEDVLRNIMWKIEAHLDQPDSAYTTMERFARLNPHFKGVGMGFLPYYYPQKGRFYEVYATHRPTGEVETRQIGSEKHNYTQYEWFRKVMQADSSVWINPVYDDEGAKAYVTAHMRPIRDRQNKTVGFAGIDIGLKELSDSLNNRHIYPSSFFLVLSETDKIVIHPDTSKVSESVQQYVYDLITDSTLVYNKSKSGRSTMIHFDTGQRDGIIFYTHMRGTPKWKIAVICYDDEAYASLQQMRVRFLLLMLVAFAVLMYVVLRFIRGERQMASTNQRLQEKEMEQKRIDGELRIANGIQQAMLPSHEVALKNISDVHIYGRLIPAKAVGGDLYNFLERDDKLFFCIGDVSGKGVPAALLMAVTQTLLHSISLREDNPARIMDRINKTTASGNRQNIFVTLFIGILDLPTGNLRYCNAGHDTPIILRDNGLEPNGEPSQQKCELLEAKPNLPIGLFSDFNYEMQEMVLPPQTTLVLYTDGLTEARNAEHKLFGLERVKQILNHSTNPEPGPIIETVLDQVKEFVGEAEQSDDLTMLSVRYVPQV